MQWWEIKKKKETPPLYTQCINMSVCKGSCLNIAWQQTPDIRQMYISIRTLPSNTSGNCLNVGKCFLHLGRCILIAFLAFLLGKLSDYEYVIRQIFFTCWFQKKNVVYLSILFAERNLFPKGTSSLMLWLSFAYLHGITH